MFRNKHVGFLATKMPGYFETLENLLQPVQVFFLKVLQPYKSQVATSPHHSAKNQSFLLVPFHSSHSKTNASTNKSKDSRAKKPKTQIRKNVDGLSFNWLVILI